MSDSCNFGTFKHSKTKRNSSKALLTPTHQLSIANSSTERRSMCQEVKTDFNYKKRKKKEEEEMGGMGAPY